MRTSAPLRYVALGDSYTEGTAADPAVAFPSQLVQAIAGEPVTLDLVANLGVNGYRTEDLIREELPALDSLAPDFVTLLIGANDVVQGVSVERYEANLTLILDAIEALLPADRILAIGIPDYTITPRGGDYGDPVERSAALARNNGVMARLAASRGIAFVDVFDLSRRAATDPTLVADDGLHPSGAQYALWVERIAPVARGLVEP